MASKATFLRSPQPHRIVKSTIDFSKSKLPEQTGRYAVILDNVLSVEECQTLVQAAEAKTNGQWERAMVNIGGNQQALMTDVRNCGRIIWDTRDLADELWARIASHVPELSTIKDQMIVTGGGGEFEFSRLNERMRFLKYQGGEYFKAHCDGQYVTPDGSEMSYYTLHLYLNGDDQSGQEPLKGGCTSFLSFDMKRSIDVAPVPGRILLFQHRGLYHSGEDVLQGTKLTMRTDLMYREKR